MSISQELLDLYADSFSNPEDRLAVLSNMFDHYVADFPELRQAIDRLICIAKERKQREAA
jgi:protein-tyrosine phosphatase